MSENTEWVNINEPIVKEVVITHMERHVFQAFVDGLKDGRFAIVSWEERDGNPYFTKISYSLNAPQEEVDKVADILKSAVVKDPS